MKDLIKKTLLAASVALLFTGCGPTSDVAEEPEETALATQQSALAACTDTAELEETVEHACSHATYGPFQNVTASPLGTASLVDVSLPHTAYVVTLPKKGSGGWGGSVVFTPEEGGEYAFLLSRHRGLRIFDNTTHQEITRECRYRIPDQVCGALETAILADLEPLTEYRLEFQAVLQRNAKFTLLIEEAGHHDH